MLRPNVTRPDHTAAATVDTPPFTDYSSQGDIESESELTSASDRELLESSAELERPQSALSLISETSPSNPSHRYRAVPAGELSDDDWSVIGGDTDADVSGNEHGSLPVTEELEESGVDSTPRANPDTRVYNHHSVRQSPLSRVWDRRTRASSSPSRSPARRSLRRVVARVDPPRASSSNSFYEYLFPDRDPM